GDGPGEINLVTFAGGVQIAHRLGKFPLRGHWRPRDSARAEPEKSSGGGEGVQAANREEGKGEQEGEGAPILNGGEPDFNVCHFEGIYDCLALARRPQILRMRLLRCSNSSRCAGVMPTKVSYCRA